MSRFQFSRFSQTAKRGSLISAFLVLIPFLLFFSIKQLSASHNGAVPLIHPEAEAHALTFQSGTITEVVKLTASDAFSTAFFGHDVAISGETLAVGAYREKTFETAAGAVYIFEQNEGGPNQWGEVKKIVSEDLEAGDWFGHSIAFDGDTLVVGAPLSDDAGGQSGSAYVFQRDMGGAGQWGQVAKLTASNALMSDEFGYAVTISGDTIAVGAHRNDVAGLTAGSVYIFERNAGGTDQWGETKIIIADSTVSEDQFGFDVALSNDTLIVGAPFHDEFAEQAGKAYVFERNQGGSEAWGEVAQLVATEIESSGRFGDAVAIDGDTVVVGSFASDPNGSASGSAYVFDRNNGGANAWGAVQLLVASDGDGGDWFGDQVAVYGDRVVIGAHQDDDFGQRSGSAYVYERDFGGTDAWGEVIKLTASDAAEFDRFGFSVAVNANFILVGAEESSDDGADSGSAYVFRITPAPAPEIAVTGNSIEIENGDVTPQSSDGTDFGGGLIGSETVTRTFVIENSGNLDLNLTGTPDSITLSGTHADDFAVVEHPNAVIAGGGSSTVTIAFSPTGVGVREATVLIPNDDADENPYTFVIQGEGVNPTGTISIVLTAVPTNNTPFDFTLTDLSGSSTPPQQFVLTDPDTPSQTFENLPVGEYSLTALPLPTAWVLSDLSCSTTDSNDTSVISISEATAVVDLDEDESITCTFVSQKQATLTVVKEAGDGSVGAPEFTFTGDAPIGTFGLTLGESQAFTLLPGVYVVTEGQMDGWQLTDVSCHNGTAFTAVENGIAITIEGEDTACTFVNNEVVPGSLTIIKEATPADGTDFGFYIGEPDPDEINTIAGNGSYGFSGDGGLATEARVYNPYGVAVDDLGNVYIADTYNHRVRKVDTNGIITTIAGTGQRGFNGDGILAIDAHIIYPTDVVVDNRGNVYFADWGNNRVRKIDTNGIISTVAGNGAYGFSGDGGLATEATLRRPWSIDINDAGEVFFVDFYNYRVRMVDTNGIIATIAGNGSFGLSTDGIDATNSAFGNLYGLAVDDNGNVYLSERYSGRVGRRYTTSYLVKQIDSNGILTTFAGQGSGGYSGDGGVAINAQLYFPHGLATDSAGNVYIADYYNRRVRMVDTDGIITTVAGTGSYGFNGEGIVATEANISGAYDVAISTVGELYIIDFGTRRIRKVATPSDFYLDDEISQTDDVENSLVFTDLESGSYDITENLRVGWQLTDVVCSGGSGNYFSLSEQTLSVVINDGEAIVCRFINSNS